MTYPMAPMAGGPGPGTYPPPPPWTPPPPPRRGTTALLGLAAAVLAAGLVGGIVGALLTHRSNTSDTPASTTAAQEAVTPEDVRAQDIKLCTEYALINAATPKPVKSEDDLLAAVAAVRTSLAAYPDASADIRSALNDVVDSYFAMMANFTNKGSKGLVEPPQYDEASAQATFDSAWALCGLK